MNEEYDIVVIGGGIHGAGVAQAAAAAGYRTLLLEQKEIASGTSSRSSKLIHGGLRYLEHAHFSLVRECLRERAILLRLAPSLIRLRPFYIPLYASTTRRPWQVRAGLSLYAVLGGMGPDSRFQKVPKREWETLDGLETRDLQAVFRYYDAQTDDAALTRAVVRSAQSLGAEIQERASFLGAELEEGGVQVQYRRRERECCCRTRVLVNAGGPWVNMLLEKIEPRIRGLAVDLVQGAHIVLAGTVEKGIYYMEALQDRRAVFVMPWKGRLLVGSTETSFEGNPEDLSPLSEEVDYLLETLRKYFPRYEAVNRGEVLESFAGLRVLPKGIGLPFGRSRETLLHVDREECPRVLTVYGGKLTSYRATAEKILGRVAASLPCRPAVADTKRLPLEGE